MNLLTLIQQQETYVHETNLMSEFPYGFMVIFYIISIVLFYVGIIYLYILIVKYLKLKINKLKKEL